MINHIPYRRLWLHRAVTYLISVRPYHKWVQRTLLHSVWVKNLFLREGRQLTQSHGVLEIGT